MAENIHLLTKEIHQSSFNDIRASDGTVVSTADAFAGRLTALLSDYPANSIYMVRALRELNRKLSESNQSSKIVGLTDAGFRPLSDDFFGTVLTPKNQNNVSNASLAVTWDSDFKGVNIEKTAITSSNHRMRLLAKVQPDKSVLSFPSTYRLSFTVTQNNINFTTNRDINTFTHSAGGGGNNPTNTAATYPLHIVFRDDDTVDETPDFYDKGFLKVLRGFNSFDIELFDDGAGSNPAISLMAHRHAKFNVDVDNIEIRKIS